MNRIRKAYAARFRTALWKLGARRLEQGVEQLLARADFASESQGTDPSTLLGRLDERLRRQIERLEAKQNGPGFDARRASPTVFVCDAGLGGLARWLRAAGYEAHWAPDTGDAELLRTVRKAGATLLTTDGLLLERRLIRDGVVPTLWLPPMGDPAEQLARVFREFRLKLRAPRCMSCGGELRIVDKTEVAARIPPRTARWLNEYFVCTRCDRLFWRGTHWQRIQARLRALGESPRA